MSQRLTRKEMKQKDQFVTSVEQTLDYSRSHIRTILYAVVGAIALALVVLVVTQFLSHRSAKASAALAAAMDAYEAPIEGADTGEVTEGDLTFPDEAARKARAKELFLGVEEDYGSTSAGAVSLIYLARMAADEGDLATARGHWQDYVDRRGNDIVAAQLRLNLLDLERQEEGGAEAVATKLEAMLDDGKRALPEDVLLYELATTLEDLSRSEEALTYYQRIIDEFPQSQYSALARQKSAKLGAPPTTAVG